MPHTNYAYQTRDLKFQAKEWLDMDKLLATPDYAEMFEIDDLDSFLDLNYSICKDVICPANGDADEIGWKYDPENVEHAVTATQGMRDAFHAVVDNGIGMQFGNRDGSCAYTDMKMPLAWYAPILEMQSAASAGIVMNWCITQGATTVIQFEADKKYQDLYLPKMYAGQWGGTMCLTEPNAGSEVGNCATKCWPVEGTPGLYKVKGNKIFITSGDSDVFDNIIHLVLAKTPNARPGTSGISLLMVPKFWVEDDGTVGKWNDVTTVGIEHKMGIHGSVTCSLAFGENDNCYGWMVGEGPDENGRGQGIAQMFNMMNEERLNTGVFSMGVIGAAYYASLEHARIRVQGRKVGSAKGDMTQVRIIEHPDVRRMLMYQKSVLEAARALLYSTYYAVDMSHEADEAEAKAYHDIFMIQNPLCKAWVSDMAWRMTEQCIQTHGGYGFIEEYPGAQLARDCKIHSLWEGTNFMQAQDFTGRKFTMDGGEPFKKWVGVIKDFVATQKIDALAPAWATMEKGLEAYEEILATDAGWKANKQKEMTDLFATRMLHASAAIYCAKCLLEQAVLASKKLAEIGEDHFDANFYKSKMATATFFVQNVMPDEVFGCVNSMRTADRTAFDMDEALFDC